MALDKLVANAFVARKNEQGGPNLVLNLPGQAKASAYDWKIVAPSMKLQNLRA